jgi:hypothetical protein
LSFCFLPFWFLSFCLFVFGFVLFCFAFTSWAWEQLELGHRYGWMNVSQWKEILI